MIRLPGPLCGYSQRINVKDGTLNLVASPRPGIAGMSLPASAPARTHESAFVGGTPVDEARSLLRPCLPRGRYGLPLAKLPEPLGQLVGKPVAISAEQLTNYLAKQSLIEDDMGGPVSHPLPKAHYLVIHDTSSSVGRLTRFPDNIDTAGWAKNQYDNLGSARDAHVFVSRLGTSKKAFDFSLPFSSTKYTMGQSAALKAKFCHVELIQPRLIDAAGSDWQAPAVGFPAAQLERLALIYVCASVRQGCWLVPAYHHNVDLGLPAHDDPQNFSLDAWCEALAGVIKDVSTLHPAGDFSRRAATANAS